MSKEATGKKRYRPPTTHVRFRYPMPVGYYVQNIRRKTVDTVESLGYVAIHTLTIFSYFPPPAGICRRLSSSSSLLMFSSSVSTYSTEGVGGFIKDKTRFVLGAVVPIPFFASHRLDSID